MATTSAPLGANFGQQGPNFHPAWAHLAPTLAQLASNMPQLGPKLDPGATSAQVEAHMASTWGTWPAQSEITKTPVITDISHVFWASMTLRVEQCTPCYVPVGPILARSCRQRVPSCGRFLVKLLTGASGNISPPSLISTYAYSLSRRSHAKAWFSQLRLAVFGGRLAGKRPFRMKGFLARSCQRSFIMFLQRLRLAACKSNWGGCKVASDVSLCAVVIILQVNLETPAESWAELR